ncbi:MAG: LysM peptidoglycan-binding domain-containing protein [Solirubrobacterales bacterium]|nr:LysM peptidoglycan-binding domain-containing protein [Solirubrobacterales bacterium]
MQDKKNSLLARLLAAVALITAVVAIVVAIGAATSSDEEPNKGRENPSRQVNKPKTKAKTYEVEEGDSLTAIAEKTGISVDRLEKLNPDLDPQALQPGQELKLR